MNKLPFWAAFFWLLILFAACGSDDEPYIRFKTADGSYIDTQVIPVDLNTEWELYVDIGFQEEGGINNLIHYEQKIDDGPVMDLTFTGMLDILVVGAHNNLTIEKAKILLSFSQEVVSTGSQVMITVRDDGTLIRTLTFQVR